MQELFPGYYKKRSKEQLAESFRKATIAVDSNILLNLFSFKRETTTAWLAALQSLSDSQRLWVPHQVLFEYHLNVEGAIALQSKTKIENISKTLELRQIQAGDSETLEKQMAECAVISESAREELLAEIAQRNELVRTAEKKLIGLVEKEQRGYIAWCSSIKQKLAALITKAGQPYEPEEFRRKCRLAESRFLQKVPPGYEDRGKAENPFGDALIWFQLLDYAKAQPSRSPVVFVTAEKKKDWFYMNFDGQLVGPRAELVQEMRSFAEVEFHLYRAETFLLAMGNAEPSIEIKQDAVNETRMVPHTSPVPDTRKAVSVAFVPVVTGNFESGGNAVFWSGDDKPFWSGGDTVPFWSPHTTILHFESAGMPSGSETYPLHWTLSGSPTASPTDVDEEKSTDTIDASSAGPSDLT